MEAAVTEWMKFDTKAQKGIKKAFKFLVLRKICYKGKGASDFERALPAFWSFSW